MADTNPTTNYQQDDGFSVGPLQIAAYMFAGLAMMLNIRLSYSAAPFALLRFKLPENLFSVFVRTTSSALELWCIPSMLIGNIMEQFYNHTQTTPSYHDTGIKTYDLKNKGGTLKTNAKTHSDSELASTQNTDLQQTTNIPEGGLGTKATTLAQKAEELNRVANAIVEAAQNPNSPLKPLEEQARELKNSAGDKSSGGGLYKTADELASQTGTAATHANKVIKTFENVDEDYEELMKQAKAKELTSNPEVTNVVKAYLEVKTTYYQMLIGYRFRYVIGTGGDDKIIANANQLHIRAQALASKLQTGQQGDPTKPELIQLATNLATATDTVTDGLQKALQALKSAADANNYSQIVTRALEVITKYKAVTEAYEKVKARETDYKRVASREYTPVKEAFKALKEKFGPLKKSYENVLKLRVQELSDKAQTLFSAADELKTYDELGPKADALASAASQPIGQKGLKQKAEALRDAIKTKGDTSGTQATAVIQKFDIVTARYNDLANLPKYKELLKSAKDQEAKGQSPSLGDVPEKKVKNVYDAYNDLKKLYDSILNFTKIKYYSGEVSNAADPNGVNAEKVITNFNSLVDSHKLLDDPDKSIVKSQFEDLQKEYSKAIYFYKFCIITIPSMITNWLNFLTFVILLIVFVTGGDQGHVTGYYVIMAISGFVFGINMVLVYAVDYRYLPFYMAGENSFPMVTSLILYFATSIFGNRRKYNSDYLVVVIDVSIAIIIAFVAAVLWTVAFHDYRAALGGELKPIWPALISPIAMVIVGMGLVYSIYPGVAPGMIVPFYLIDKIEMVLLVATAFPPVIIAFLRKYAENWSPSTQFLLHSGIYNMGGWKHYNANADGWPPTPGADVHGWIWHFFDILIPLKIALAVVFIYSLHYRDSSIARAIINQPKMSTFLTIIFYMCHEILLALGFPGMVGNGGAGGKVMLPVQYVGALLMVFLAFYSIGYITEYKKHDPSQWPTDGMTTWNALCYWLKMASKITNKNFKQLFTTDLLCDLIDCTTPCYIEDIKKRITLYQINFD